MYVEHNQHTIQYINTVIIVMLIICWIAYVRQFVYHKSEIWGFGLWQPASDIVSIQFSTSIKLITKYCGNLIFQKQKKWLKTTSFI